MLRGRAEPLGINIVMGDPASPHFGADVFGAFAQSPDDYGAVIDLREFIARAHAQNVLVAVATDLLALTVSVPPGEMGADVVVGSAQRFGVPMGYGGPHAAFLATREAFVRQAPGRIIGVSIDSHGNLAYRMALQTREQHIRREKATSNICTAQALLANIAAMYGVYHGPDGLTAIARQTHALAVTLERAARSLGYTQQNDTFFDTLRIRVPDGTGETTVEVKAIAERARMNFRYFDNRHIGIALDETTTLQDVQSIAAVLAEAAGKPCARCRTGRRIGSAVGPAGADVAVHDASRLFRAPLGNEDDAVSEAARAQGRRTRSLDDSARLVHDEAERRLRDDPGHVAGIFGGASLRTDGSGRRLRTGH